MHLIIREYFINNLLLYLCPKLLILLIPIHWIIRDVGRFEVTERKIA